jgi:hypothetical protein
VRLLASSTSGSWVALCDGTPSQAKLVLASGTTDIIDDVLAQGPKGRFVVVSRAGAAQLYDAASGTVLDLSALGADIRRVRADYAEHRTLSFDADGRHLAYLSRRDGELRVVVRTLETGTEQTYAPGPGEVYRLKLSADARYATFDALREDSNHNGKLDWPAPEEPPQKACAKPGLPKFRSFAYQGRGDVLTPAVIQLDTGSLRDLPELVTPLGASVLVREADGSLRLDQAGKRTPLAPASCAGRVLFADAERGLVVVNCTPPPKKAHGAPAAPLGKRDVWLFGAGFAKNLQSQLYETATDRDAVVGTRLVPLYPGSDSAVLDLERRELLPLASGSRVVATSGAKALLWREGDLYRYDALSKTEQRLAHGVLKNPDLLSAGGTVLLSPFVIVGCDGPVFTGPSGALALTSSGFVLTASGPGAARAAGGPKAVGQQPGAVHRLDVIEGPLRWVDAKVPPPDGPPR